MAFNFLVFPRNFANKLHSSASVIRLSWRLSNKTTTGPTCTLSPLSKTRVSARYISFFGVQNLFEPTPYMGPHFGGNIMFSAACYQFVKSVGKNTLLAVPSIDEKDNVKPLHLAVKSKKRQYIFFEKAVYHPTEFLLTDVLTDRSPLKTKCEEIPLISDFNRKTKISLKGKFGAEISKELLDVDVEASDSVTLNIQFGKVIKSEVNEPELLSELGDRYINLDHPYVQQLRQDPTNVLCIITGVAHLQDEGTISRDTDIDAKTTVKVPVVPNVEVSAEAEFSKDRDIGLPPNTPLAYNVHELNVSTSDGGIQLVLARGQHGGFRSCIGYDEVDATSVLTDAVEAGRQNIDQLHIDLQRPRLIFQPLIDMSDTSRHALTSVLLSLLSTPRDIAILGDLMDKVELGADLNTTHDALQRRLYSQEQDWKAVLDVAGVHVQDNDQLAASSNTRSMAAALAELFDAILMLDDDEIDLIRHLPADTGPSIIHVLQEGIKGCSVSGEPVQVILNNSIAQKLLLQLQYSISLDTIEAPTELPPSIDEVYWTVFALWGK